MLLAPMAAILAGGQTAASPAFATASIAGTATVIDGDTIEIHGSRIRLDAIDAPESRQQCWQADGKPYPCDRRSAFALADMIGGTPLRCEPKGHDRDRRIIAVCFKGGTNLNAWMVREGWAVAFRKYGIDYIAEEDTARKNRAGLWAGSFDMSWDWRARNR